MYTVFYVSKFFDLVIKSGGFGGQHDEYEVQTFLGPVLEVGFQVFCDGGLPDEAFLPWLGGINASAVHSLHEVLQVLIM